MYPDIFFTREYQELLKDTAFGGEPCHFNCGGIDYRFYRRPIEGTPYFDIVSPYGYSGPVAIETEFDWISFRACFNAYCRQNNIVAEFARLHPWLNLLYGETLYERDIFYIDLTQTEEQIWKGFDKGCKSAVKKAGKQDFAIKHSNYWDDCLDFDLLYKRCIWLKLEKGESSEEYLFANFRHDSPIPIDLIALWDRNGIVAGAIILEHGDYCHYFLAAGGNQNLILWEAIKRAKKQGCKIFNLGGGLKSGDSLESFKRSFSKTSKPFYTYRKIHNREIYNELCRAKGIDPESDGYFPAYRRNS